MIKQKIIKCFNKGASTYDVAADIQVCAAKKLAHYLDKPANYILEIGCGTGLFSQYIINQFPDKNILLTDIAPQMIKASREKFLNYPNVVLASLDGEKLEFRNRFDLVASSMALHWFTNFIASMKNIIDQLAPGGQFIFSLLGENTLKEWRETYIPTTLNFPSQELLKNHFPEMHLIIENQVQCYASVQDFLNTLKQVGGTALHSTYSAPLLGKLRQILRSSSGPFDVTYEIIYGRYIKP